MTGFVCFGIFVQVACQNITGCLVVQGFYPKNTLNEAFELGMKQQLKKKGIKGKLTFGLKPDGVDVQGNPYDLIDQITINLDN